MKFSYIILLILCWYCQFNEIVAFQNTNNRLSNTRIYQMQQIKEKIPHPSIQIKNKQYNYIYNSCQSGKISKLYCNTEHLLNKRDSNSDSISNKLQVPLGLISLIAFEKSIQYLFQQYAITFPSSLGGMIFILMILSGINIFSPKVANNITNWYQSTLNWLKLWLTLFYIPPLIIIPLKLKLLKNNEFKILSVTIIGLILSLTSSGLLSNSLRSSQLKKPVDIQTPSKSQLQLPHVKPLLASSSIVMLASGKNKVLINGFHNLYFIGLLSRFSSSSTTIIPVLRKVFGFQSTILAFLISSLWIPSKLKKVFHPVLVTTLLSIMCQYLFGLSTFTSLSETLSFYYGSISGKGAGDIISYMLTPAILSFGIQLFQYKTFIMSNIITVLGTTIFSSVFALYSSKVLSNVFKINQASVSSSLLTRCITSPLALAGSNLTGADPTLAALIVLITGWLGSSFGQLWLESLKIEDPLSVGLSIGACSHGLGAASLSDDSVKFSAAIVSMTLTGLFTVLLLSFYPIRKLLL